ncbi:hypothetical protein AURDEDRAFT_135190 [Auricularia subglabra TFB-10046 SS5]|nr:hypothetical protein AURDEDRAFT_135190 [Auricularia subglabra TFB-10046 SS5]
MSTPSPALQSLISQKDGIQAALDAQYSILSSHGVGLTDALVDAEGFPRADVDVYAVRHARVRVIELRNDLRAVMDKLADALAGAFPGDASDASSEGSKDDEAPFARVDGVAPGSPAAGAGLQRDDLFVKFGTLTASSFVGASLTPLVQLVGAHENRSIPLKVRRGSGDVFLSLTPRQGWGGRGMLGCHIVPYKA